MEQLELVLLEWRQCWSRVRRQETQQYMDHLKEVLASGRAVVYFFWAFKITVDMNLEFEILVHKFIGNYSKSLIKPKKSRPQFGNSGTKSFCNSFYLWIIFEKLDRRNKCCDYIRSKKFSTRLTFVKKCWFLVKNQYIYLTIYPYNCNNDYFIIWNVIWWRFKWLFIIK